jgi:predicted nucleotidyltransferase
MRIDRNERIAGQPILRVRDCLRPYMGDDNTMFGKNLIVERLKVSERKAGQILRELKARGLIESAQGKFGKFGKGYFILTMKGNAFAGAHALKPISRAKADKILADFMKRVAEVNSSDEITDYVHEVRVFGSFLNKKAKDLGDIDLAVDTRRREVPGRDVMEYMEERAVELGVENRSWMARLLYVELEARRLIKARNPYISLHPMSDIEATGSKSKVLYRWKGKR